jgi:hypothetical protein
LVPGNNEALLGDGEHMYYAHIGKPRTQHFSASGRYELEEDRDYIDRVRKQNEKRMNQERTEDKIDEHTTWKASVE